MKRFLSALLFISTILGVSLTPALAENFTYKVYNPKTNKTTIAVFGTVTITENQYLWGFYTKDGQPLCVASLNTNKNPQGLIGGQCTDIGAFIRFMNGENIDFSKYELGWRELSQDTFYSEMNSIRQERAAQGKYEYKGSN